MFFIKTEKEIEYIRFASNIVKIIHKQLKKMIKPGITGIQLNWKAEEIIKKYGCKPNFKGLYNFPASICVSLNNVLVHGIPNNIPFQAGDLVSIDMGCSYNGYHSDSAFSMIVGKTNNLIHKKLIKVTKTSLDKVIKILKPNIKIGDIGHIIQNYVESNGFYLPREFSGHGIGKKLHEDPYIPNFGTFNTGIKLKSGMTICVEPMVQIGTKDIKILNDNWTPVSKDGSYSAHFEHTILITDNGCEILT